jgi:hypothetical protein
MSKQLATVDTLAEVSAAIAYDKCYPDKCPQQVTETRYTTSFTQGPDCPALQYTLASPHCFQVRLTRAYPPDLGLTSSIPGLAHLRLPSRPWPHLITTRFCLPAPSLQTWPYLIDSRLGSPAPTLQTLALPHRYQVWLTRAYPPDLGLTSSLPGSSRRYLSASRIFASLPQCYQDTSVLQDHRTNTSVPQDHRAATSVPPESSLRYPSASRIIAPLPKCPRIIARLPQCLQNHRVAT